MATEQNDLKQNKNYIRNYIIFFQALTGTLGSLYFEHFGNIIKNLESGNLLPSGTGIAPCTLCWRTRILLYPIVRFSGFALIQKDAKIVYKLIRVSLAGIILTLYQHVTELAQYQAMEYCKANDCSDVFIQYFGFLTIPLLGTIAFVIIFVCCLLAIKAIQKNRNKMDKISTLNTTGSK